VSDTTGMPKVSKPSYIKNINNRFKIIENQNVK